MNVLILFATYSGSTQTVADYITKILKHKNHVVTMENPKQTTIEHVQSSDIVILCSPSWDVNGKDGQPHEDYFSFIKNTESSLFEGKRFAIVGLGDSSYPHFCGGVTILEEFVAKKMGVLVIPSLRIDGFFYDQDKNLKNTEEWANRLTTDTQ